MSVLRTFQVTNVYPGATIVTTASVELNERSEFDTDEAYDGYLNDSLYAITGTGREGGEHAGYFVESIDDIDPPIKKEWC